MPVREWISIWKSMWLDVTGEEARKLLLTGDPLAALALA
jgi:hypothetical protein